jgi:chaperonin cofactor prefoldin
MFNKKKKEKDFNFKLKIIEKIGTLETQNKFLMERIVALEEELQKHIQGGN